MEIQRWTGAVFRSAGLPVLDWTGNYHRGKVGVTAMTRASRNTG